MTADEFAHQLAEYLRIPVEPKANTGMMDASTRTGNVLLDFVRVYDTSQREIGMITFPPVPLKTKRGWHVADFEADPILLDSASGELWLKVYGEDHILCYCAKDSDRFLDALLIAARLSFEDDDEQSSEQDARAREAAEACTAAAGGERYHTFYFMLFGAL